MPFFGIHNFIGLPTQWRRLLLTTFVLAMAFPLTLSLVEELKELDYLRALDDSISYRVVFKPFDELPEQYLPSERTTTGPTTTSPLTTTAPQEQQFSEQAEQQQQDDDVSVDGEEGGQRQTLPPLPSHLPSPPPPSSPASFSSSSASMEQQHKLVKIVSADAEEYQCVLPMLAPSSKKRIELYHGPSPAELIQSIYREQICSYRIEPYWHYELCHGRYVLQYHEDKESKKRTEYFLGNFVAMNAEVEARHFDQLNPPTRKLGDERLAYYPVTYTHGTVCDLTGKPRQTTVLYVCDEDARQNIHSISEVSSCHYEIVVLAREICAHPSFQPAPASEYEIRCYAAAPPASTTDQSGVDDNEKPPPVDPKPKAMQLLEEEQRNDFVGEYGLFRSSSPFQMAKNVFAKLLKHTLDDDVLEASLNQWDAIFEAMKKVGAAAQQRGEGGDEPRGGDGSAPPNAPPTKPAASGGGALSSPLVDRFWRGDVCLQGGTGWWKHEVCLGRTVSQYHEEAAEDGTKQRRQTILLGKFDEAVHKAWATEHPDKAVERKLDGTVMQVAHMYTQGDLCTETGAHRDCQVRMKCREDINGQKVFIYMLEPSTCSYVVVLESSIFCAKLQHVDKYGLIASDEATAAAVPTNAKSGDAEGKDPAAQQRLKRRTFGDSTVVFDLANQEEIMRVVRQLLEGAGEGQVLVSAAQLKIGKDSGDADEAGGAESAEGEATSEEKDGHGEASEEGVTAAKGREGDVGREGTATDNETERERVLAGGGETGHGDKAATTQMVQQRRGDASGAETVPQGKDETREVAHEEEEEITATGQQQQQQKKEGEQQRQQAMPGHRAGEL